MVIKYRSLQFVPAQTAMLDKISRMNAGAYIIDLEDAVLAEDKTAALSRTADFLATCDFAKDIFVRINPENAEQELSVLNGYAICGYMVPKAGSAENILSVRRLCTDKQIIALIETPQGAVNIAEIINSADAIAFGGEDYTASTGIKKDEAHMAYVKSRLVMYAKACKKPIFDTMSLNIRDKTAYLQEAVSTREYGFDGKLSIHPMQTDVINEVFAEEDYAYYRYVICEYEKCGNAVMELDGRVFEKPHIDMYKQKLENGKIEW